MVIHAELREIKELAQQVISKVNEIELATVHEWGISIAELGLSNRALACLRKANIEYAEQLQKLTRPELLRLRNMGQKTTQEIFDRVRDYGG